MPLFSFEGLRPRIHASAFVAPTATLVGDVIVEEGASVWYGVVIRADYAPVIVRRARERAGQRGDPRPPGLTTDVGLGRHDRPQLRRARRVARGGVHRRQRRRSCSTARRSAPARSSRPARWSPRARRSRPGMLAAGSPAVVRRPVKGSGAEIWVELESRRLRRARPAPPPRHRLRRPRRELAQRADRSQVEARLAFGAGRRDRVHVAFAQDEVLLAADLDLEARCRARTARGRRPRSCARSGPAATTSAHTSRRSTLAVAGMRMPARDLRSPASVDGARSSRSAVMRIECLTSSCGSAAMRAPGYRRTRFDPASGTGALASLAPMMPSGAVHARGAARRALAALACSARAPRAAAASSSVRAHQDRDRRHDHRRRVRHSSSTSARSRPRPARSRSRSTTTARSSTRSRSTDTAARRSRRTPARSATGTVTLAKGTYNFECTIPGHAAAGMKGKVVVA